MLLRNSDTFDRGKNWHRQHPRIWANKGEEARELSKRPR